MKKRDEDEEEKVSSSEEGVNADKEDDDEDEDGRNDFKVLKEKLKSREKVIKGNKRPNNNGNIGGGNNHNK